MFKRTLKSTLAFIMTLAMILTLLPAITLPARAADFVYVNADTGNDTTGDGTSSKPYKTFTKGYSETADGGTLDLTGIFTWTDADETDDAGMAGFTIDKNITIQGHGAGTTVIQAASSCGGSESRVFTVDSDITVTFDNLEIRYGYLAREDEEIYKEFYGGGGLELSNGDITISNCYIHHNKAAKMGFGIDASKPSVTLNINDSVIAYNNSSSETAGSPRGGGIFTFGTTTITNSTISNNSGVDQGAGVYVENTTIVMTNCTVAYNSTNDGSTYGGGIYFKTSTATVTNCTIAHNSCKSNGGGISLDSSNLTLKNTIIARNTCTNDSTTGDFDNYSGTITDNGYNIIEHYTTTGFTGTGDKLGEQASADLLKLSDTLADNGGGTQTLALEPGSVAIDAGGGGTNGSVSVPSTDQRGLTRDTQVDIGAYEYIAVTATAPTVTTQAVSSITSTTATGNGNITTLGTPNPTAHGVCWNTTGTPTLSDSKTDEGAASATGAFTTSMTGLTANTTYYVRAYATNTAGTSYGSQVSFTTSAASTAPTVTTQAVSSITSTAATGNGNITALGTPNPTAHGVCWNTTGTPTTSDSKTDEGAASATGAFTTSMTGLTANTTYYVRAYATNTADTSYGAEVSFTTNSASTAPTVTTQDVSSVGTTTATGNGNVTALGTPNPTAHGVCWNTTGTPTTSDSKTDEGAASATGAFTSSMSGLAANTTYYVRAYATNTAGTSYGSQVSFTTSAASTVPTVTTQAVSSITSTTATGNGNITALGSPNPTAHGVCWNTTGTPTLSDSKTNEGAASATGAFITSMTGLTANTTYYVRAYATNTAGTSYGSQVSFTTSAVAPTVTTQAVSDITSTTATGNGNITALGSPNPTAHGVCWNTTGMPTLSDSKTDEGAASATGAFITSMTGLTANTTYYVRAYATNTAGTSYGSQVSFTTSAASTVPTVTTQAVSSITSTTATGNGNITALGSPNPTAHGVCWNTTGTPTLSDSKTDEGAASATGAFITSMTGLTANTTYYVRAYATNTAGTSYGSQVSFTTSANTGGYSLPGFNDTDTGNASTDTNVEVNGQSYSAGTSVTGTNARGQTVTTVTVDTDKLQDILENQGQGATVTIPVATGSSVASGVLTGDMLDTMEQNGATLVIDTGNATYTLPAEEININTVSEQLGENVSLGDITVTVSVSAPADDMVTVVENTAGDGGYTLVVPAVEFTVSCTYGDQTINVTSFDAYVDRTITIPDGVDPSQITTAVVVDADGTAHSVPTEIVYDSESGHYVALIHSLTNSVYTVIWNPVEFPDVENHWARDAINDMGSRMIVTGNLNGNFNPDNSITRAEFAAIMVRALGLAPGVGTNRFSDVVSSSWYCGYVKTATAYGIITGYDDGTFRPNDLITREQAMTMLARAMDITKLSPSLSDSQVTALLVTYSDSTDVSNWAKTSIAACLETGVITGRTSTTLSPKENITRAEVAVVVQQLLQKSGLI